MVQHQSYSASVFHGIPSLHECNAGFHSKGGTEFLTMHLRPLIRAYGYEERYGVGLVHKHFEIKPDEILVEYQSITSPWKVRTNYHGAAICPTAWTFTGDEMIPYEFEFYGGAVGSRTTGREGRGCRRSGFPRAEATFLVG
jgi:hypothetical protein